MRLGASESLWNCAQKGFAPPRGSSSRFRDTKMCAVEIAIFTQMTPNLVSMRGRDPARTPCCSSMKFVDASWRYLMSKLRPMINYTGICHMRVLITTVIWLESVQKFVYILLVGLCRNDQHMTRITEVTHLQQRCHLYNWSAGPLHLQLLQFTLIINTNNAYHPRMSLGVHRRPKPSIFNVRFIHLSDVDLYA